MVEELTIIHLYMFIGGDYRRCVHNSTHSVQIKRSFGSFQRIQKDADAKIPGSAVP